MKKQDFKKLIKPIVKECINEAILESGLLSNVISEVVKGLGIQALNEQKAVKSNAHEWRRLNKGPIDRRRTCRPIARRPGYRHFRYFKYQRR